MLPKLQGRPAERVQRGTEMDVIEMSGNCFGQDTSVIIFRRQARNEES